MRISRLWESSTPTSNTETTGCSKWPSSKATASEEAMRTLRYVEPLSDARTMLADFFSILIEWSELQEWGQPS
jgi:hypothetical protein